MTDQPSGEGGQILFRGGGLVPLAPHWRRRCLWDRHEKHRGPDHQGRLEDQSQYRSSRMRSHWRSYPTFLLVFFM